MEGPDFSQPACPYWSASTVASSWCSGTCGPARFGSAGPEPQWARAVLARRAMRLAI